MILNHNSKIIMMLIMPLLFSCKSVFISDIKKQYISAGSRFDTSKMKYSVIIESSKEAFKVVSIEISDKKYQNLTIIEIPNGKLKNQQEILSAGTYHVSINVGEAIFPRESIENLKLNVLVKNKPLILEGKVTVEKKRLRR
ncbi:hypothetical protein G1K97_05415 [Tenacibaculum finnmarkense]|uniref:hypothetical protein n=1 Tax=Tenacibaculum finnmarkense TaxID=2781243 RepID=UPI001EFBA2B0|nr:hypothetical protein [Tenacibaculum finnmarkense]MCG8893450.1 hypothetical protein [Tenacibaculum finnmarkense]MCG8901277.1 hypothetical protein [Tenacibaculum finnmarkense]